MFFYIYINENVFLGTKESPKEFDATFGSEVFTSTIYKTTYAVSSGQKVQIEKPEFMFIEKFVTEDYDKIINLYKRIDKGEMHKKLEIKELCNRSRRVLKLNIKKNRLGKLFVTNW
jgi:hypothetical protein